MSKTLAALEELVAATRKYLLYHSTGCAEWLAPQVWVFLLLTTAELLTWGVPAEIAQVQPLP